MADESLAPPVAEILSAARDRPTPTDQLSVAARPIVQAIQKAADSGRVPIIAEVKPTSPTTDAHRNTDPVTVAEEMVAGGAAALSVLTEPTQFGGSTTALSRIREAVEVPVLRKDFILEPAQLDAVAADAVLLVVRFIDDLPTLVTAARERGMEPLVEVHTRSELERACEAGATLIGINNRDLAQLRVDLETFEQVAPAAPSDVTLVAESGIQTPADVRRMCAAGADALLIGSAIMDGDVAATTRRFVRASE